MRKFTLKKGGAIGPIPPNPIPPNPIPPNPIPPNPNPVPSPTQQLETQLSILSEIIILKNNFFQIMIGLGIDQAAQKVEYYTQCSVNYGIIRTVAQNYLLFAPDADRPQLNSIIARATQKKAELDAILANLGNGPHAGGNYNAVNLIPKLKNKKKI